MRRYSGCVIAALLAATPASADEVRKTDLGEIMWGTDDDGGAIFRIDTGKLVCVDIEGLQPNGSVRMARAAGPGAASP